LATIAVLVVWTPDFGVKSVVDEVRFARLALLTSAGFLGQGAELRYAYRVTTLRHIHRYMNDRRRIALSDGRTGKIVRVDTLFPSNDTTVTVWTDALNGPGVAKVRLDDVLGLAESDAKSSVG
jgi:hypothetical protein